MITPEIKTKNYIFSEVEPFYSLAFLFIKPDDIKYYLQWD